MASTNSHSRSSSTTSYDRPKLLRSCATAPILITSYASRNDRSNSDYAASGQNSPPKAKATTLLERMASYSYGYLEKTEERRSQNVSAEKRILSGPPGSWRELDEKASGGKSKKTKISMNKLNDGGKHGGYFSFPSFEEFDEYSEKEEGKENIPRRHSHR